MAAYMAAMTASGAAADAVAAVDDNKDSDLASHTRAADAASDAAAAATAAADANTAAQAATESADAIAAQEAAEAARDAAVAAQTAAAGFAGMVTAADDMAAAVAAEEMALSGAQMAAMEAYMEAKTAADDAKTAYDVVVALTSADSQTAMDAKVAYDAAMAAAGDAKAASGEAAAAETSGDAMEAQGDAEDARDLAKQHQADVTELQNNAQTAADVRQEEEDREAAAEQEAADIAAAAETTRSKDSEMFMDARGDRVLDGPDQGSDNTAEVNNRITSVGTVVTTNADSADNSLPMAATVIPIITVPTTPTGPAGPVAIRGATIAATSGVRQGGDAAAQVEYSRNTVDVNGNPVTAQRIFRVSVPSATSQLTTGADTNIPLPSLSGWNGVEVSRSAPIGAIPTRNFYAHVYTDITQATQITSTTTQIAGIPALASRINGSTAATAPAISGGNFTANYDHDGDPNTVDVVGTFNCPTGVQCTYTATGAAATLSVASISGYTVTGSQGVAVTSQDPDYMAFGIWMDLPVAAAGAFAVGAFANGNLPYIEPSAGAFLALQGTGTYSGPATGVYTGTTVQAFDATANLTANFGTATTGGASITGRISGITAGSLTSITLGTATVPGTGTGNGVFTGPARAGALNPAAGTDPTIAAFNGDWGAQFFGSGAAGSGHPGSMAGTFGVTDAAEGYLGAFGANLD